MNIRKTFIIILLSVVALAGFIIQASVPLIKEVRHLTGDMGLSSHRVYSIVQGKDNAVWISTQNGIDRFNGRTINNYNLLDHANYGDMAARKIQLVNGVDNVILAYDNRGEIYVYSPVYDDFIPEIDLGDILHSGMTLNRLYVTPEGTMLFCLSSGLYVKEKDGEIKPVIKDIYVNDVWPLGDVYYIGTNDGLFIHKKNSSFERKGYLPKISIETLFYDKKREKMMIGTFNDGLWEMDVKKGEITLKNDKITDPIRAIRDFDGQYLALGIDGDGVYLYDVSHQQIHHLINSDDRNDFNIIGNGVYALSNDAEGNIWVGSYTGGASLVKFTPVSSKNIIHEKGNPNSLANNNVNSILQHRNGDVWYATDLGVSICKSDGSWRHALRERVCVSLCNLPDGRIAVGTYGGGVYILNEDNSVASILNKQNSELTSNNIFCISADRQGDIWFGGIDGNLMCFDSTWRKKGEYPIFPVFSIVSIDNDRVAASTVNGFYIIDKKTGSLSSYATFEEQLQLNMSAYIIPMLFNGDGTVWLGTSGGGLNLYDISNRKVIKEYKMPEGLPSNDIFCLLKNDKGDLWIGTGKGVAVLKGDRIISLNYHPGNENECNKLAGTVLRNGDIIFGSTEGATCFNPSNISKGNSLAPLTVTRFRIEGMKPEDAFRIAPSLYEGLEKGKLSLKHDDNSFVVNFESINLRYQDDIAYKYYLENFDEGWNETLTGEAIYKKLNPGKYTLHLASVHRSDGTIIDEKTISIVICQPWYNTWWAWLLYLLIICLAAAWAIRHKLDRMQKRYYQEKIRFFINTAHDIRTPVTLAMAPLEDAKRDGNLSESTSYLINTAHRNVKKLNAITSQLLNFEKFDSEKYTMKWETIDMRDALTEEASCFEDACRRKGIEMHLDLPDSPACIHADLNLMEHILDNLISNACKYTNRGGSINLGCRNEGEEVVVTISDSGIGIPKREKKYIFSDIHRAANARESQEIGTGFGLLQVKRLVEMLKGKVSFESIENKGTIFTLVFKKTEDKANELHRMNPTGILMDEIMASVPENPASQEDMTKDTTLLIVEDNDDMREYLSRVFLPYYNVVVKSNADEALEEIESLYPDLIISDVMMPGMQGDDFCDHIKSNPETEGIPVILLTAKTQHEAVVAGLKKGADDYLTKPFSTEILMLKVKSLLDNRDRMRKYLLRRAVRQAAEPAAVIAESNVAETKAQDGNVALLPESDKKFVEKATSVVIGHLGDATFTIDMLCREMAMSRTLFYGRLKSLTGKGPQEFIRLLRLERAAELLRRGMNVNEVAEQTGFVNVKYFSTLFKKHFGVQPSRFARVDS